LKELDKLIEYIKEKKFKSAEEATNMLQRKLNPLLRVIYNLVKARDRLEGMAVMIPMPPPSRNI
jgi:hypothetical protein